METFVPCSTTAKQKYYSNAQRGSGRKERLCCGCGIWCSWPCSSDEPKAASETAEDCHCSRHCFIQARVCKKSRSYPYNQLERDTRSQGGVNEDYQRSWRGGWY